MIFTIVFLLLASSPQNKSLKTSILLSITIPGAGHFYNNDWKKGLIFFTLENTFALLATKNYLEYRKTTDNQYFTHAFGNFITFVVLKVFSVGDLYSTFHLKEFPYIKKEVQFENQ